mgnify:CR=1 FL=1
MASRPPMKRPIRRVEVGLSSSAFRADRTPAFRITGQRMAGSTKGAIERDANVIVDTLYDSLPATTLHRIFARLRHRLGFCEALGMAATCCADRTPARKRKARTP